MKIYAIINSLFYVMFGLYGLFMPAQMAASFGWTPDILGLHEIRAIWTAFIGIGIVSCMIFQKGFLRDLVKAIIFLTLCFMLGRIIGLALDGTGPRLTYIEIGVEIIWAGIGLILLRRAPQQS